MKDKLKSELEELRNEKDSLDNSKQDSYEKHKELMDIAGEYRNRAQNSSTMEDDNLFMARARGLEEKAHELLNQSEKI